MHSVDVFVRHNPVLMWLERRGWYTGNTFPGVTFVIERIWEREKTLSGDATDRREDLLDKFRRAKSERPDHFTDKEALGLSRSTMLAGADTRIALLISFLYPSDDHLYSHMLSSPQRNLFDLHLILRPTHPQLLFKAPTRARHTSPTRVALIGHQVRILPEPFLRGP